MLKGGGKEDRKEKKKRKTKSHLKENLSKDSVGLILEGG